MRLFRDLWSASPRRANLIVALILLGAAGQAAAAALAGPVLLYRSGVLFGVLAGSLIVGVLSDLAVSLLAARLTADWSARVRRQLCHVAFGQDLTALDTTPVGELLDRIDGDVYQVASSVRSQGVRIAQSIAIGVLSTVIAVGVWWPAGLVMLAISVLLVLWLRKPAREIAPARMAEEEAWSDLAAVMEESIHGQDDVRTSLARPYVLRLFAQRSSVVLQRGRRVWRKSAKLTAIASGVMRAGIALVVIGGAWALWTGRIDGARLTAIWLLALAFGATVEHLSRMVPELQYALGAWSRVLLLREAAQEPAGGSVPVDGDLEVRGLTFRYATRDDRPAALRDVSLTFARGRSYALVGRTGSGKSTLAKVLTRAVPLPAGTVFLAGTDVEDLDVEQLRRWIALVPQRTDIIAGTLAENIALFDPTLLDRAAAALDELDLGDWVADLPQGLQTRLGDGGHVLSAGQEQLVAFARILVRDPHVVILDEATARLDPLTEARVQRATERLLRDRIGIVIAHRLSTVQHCDEVVILAEGRVVEAGPLRHSERFAELLATSMRSGALVTAGGSGGVALADDAAPQAPAAAVAMSAPPKTDPPPLPAPARTRTLRQIFTLATNDPRFGLGAVALFLGLVVFGLDGAVLPWLWTDLVDGDGGLLWPVLGIVAALLITAPMPYYTSIWFPEWWVRQMLRISLRLVHGQTGPRRVSGHTPAEVVAQGGDTERVVMLADNVIDQSACVVTIVVMTAISGSFVPAAFFAGTMLLSGLAATAFGPRLARSAKGTVAARAAFATALVSSLTAARTVKLAGATEPVLAHLARLDTDRSERQRREIAVQVWARSTPSILSGLLPIGAWALFLAGSLSAGAALVTVSTLGAARWFAWTTASLISQMPSARVWTRRTVEMTGSADYSASVDGVDISAGTAPAPVSAPREPLRRLELDGFSAVHEDGTVAARDIGLTVDRGELVLVLGPVGAGKSSLLRALAGIVHHTGTMRWNGEPITEPEVFLRPNQVGYVAQLPRVFSGSVADNIQLGHDVEPHAAVATAQLEHDLAATGSGLGLVIGHKGTRLSGGQLQRLALARALAPRTELLVADDISSALDVTTELALWRALRERGVTVIGSTSKRAALAQADTVLVLIDGVVAARGPWPLIEGEWGHLAG
ncbi:ABC-type multidrug transport system fused ATPase/permease subunit [Allocatelliglobosispora scoriae]|uniref:ABC-type multidrug transport system fused ATPase/permease subunit n=1 Tax=Allocatelliglobosispora scoriae TaxID=643052 RepID=A0A841C0I6_9ACTN|nr:ABC transporter ATP-binding protein [Allocatelliglobosispora scoriae]MBB5873445.1 ABC-type multidrug transport system fused ATPase/permease subunit [Allocatelliglobosispora scoriae]